MVTSGEIRSTSRRAGLLRVVGLDMVAPLLVFQACRASGIPEVWALVASGLPPALGVLVEWVRWRALDVAGAIVLGGIGVALALALVDADPRWLLLKGAAGTAAFGVACFVSLTGRRPLLFHLGQAFRGGRHTTEGAYLEETYVKYADARSFWRTVTMTWGIAYMIQASVHAALVQTQPTTTVLAYSRIVPWLVTGALLAWTVWWGNRVQDDETATADITSDGG